MNDPAQRFFAAITLLLCQVGSFSQSKSKVAQFPASLKELGGPSREISTKRIFAALHNPSMAIREAALKDVAILLPSAQTVSREAELVADQNPRISGLMVHLLDRRLEEIASTWYFKWQFEGALHMAFQGTDVAKLKRNLYRRLRRGDSPSSARALGILGDPRAFEQLAAQIKAFPPQQNANVGTKRSRKVLESGPQGAPYFPLAMADGRQAAPLLIARLGNNELGVIRALGKTQSVVAVWPLIHELKAGPSSVKGVWIADALAEIGDQRATPFLIEIATSPEIPLMARGNLLWRIGLLGGPGAADTLMDVLDDPRQSDIHWQAASGMQALTDRDSVPALKQALYRRSGRSFQGALAALTRLRALPDR